MIKHLLMSIGLVAVLAVAAAGQDAPKNSGGPKPDDHTAVTPLRVQIVFTEYDGEKKVASLPYIFTVNADERRARPASLIRDGARIPVATGKGEFTYLDIGTNVDCSANLQEDGRYKLEMNLERSSVSPETASGSGNPIVRQFRALINQVLKDGQTVESIASTDPINGHVFRVTVTLNVVK